MPTARARDVNPGHDDVYAAVFNLVGQKPNETYEDLTKVLPSLKETDPAEIKELAARKAMRELMHPRKDALRAEYERAAAEEDIDDVSNKKGEPTANTEKDGNEVDEDDIPVIALPRTPSGFILDGPGDVKVDNFTPAAEDEDTDGQAAHDGAKLDTSPISNAAAGPHPKSQLPTVGSSGYVPTVILRASHSGSTHSTAPAVSSPTAARPASILDGDILSRARHAHSSSPQPRDRQQQGVSEDRPAPQAAGRDDEAPEVVLEPSAVLLPTVPLSNARLSRGRLSGVRAGRHSQSGSGADADGSGRNWPGFEEGAASGDDEDVPGTLPGTCQDTSCEDAVWAAMHGVDGLRLLEHLGLVGPEDTAEDETETHDAPPANGQGGYQQQERAITNGQKPAERNPHSSSVAGSAYATPDAGRGDQAMARPPAATAHPGALATGRDASAAASSAGAGCAGGGEQLVVRSAAATERPGRLPAGGPNRGPGGGGEQGDANGPTFEAVESFKLDPDFDYDNVNLTQREFPYTKLNAGSRFNKNVPSGRSPQGPR